MICLSASLSMSLVLGMSSVLLPSVTPSGKPPHHTFIPRRSLPHETQPAQSEFSILPLLLPTVTKSELNSGPQPSQDFSETVEAFSGSWVSPAKEQNPGWEPHLQYKSTKAGKDATSQVSIQALLMWA